MSIYKRIQNDKFKNLEQKSLLSLIQSEVCIDGKPMCDNDAIVRLSQMSKVCDKNIKLYSDAGKQDKVNEENAFKDLIQNYLPEAAKASDIESAISELGVERSMKSMGLVMARLKREFAVVDGNLVKSVLTGGN